jgi:hypothetical protein
VGRRAADRAQGQRAAFRALAAPFQQLNMAEHRRQRRTELVREGGDQRVLERIALQQGAALRFEFGAHLLEPSQRARLLVAGDLGVVRALLHRPRLREFGAGVEQQQVEAVAVGQQVHVRVAATGQFDEGQHGGLVDRHAGEQLLQHARGRRRLDADPGRVAGRAAQVEARAETQHQRRGGLDQDVAQVGRDQRRDRGAHAGSLAARSANAASTLSPLRALVS